MWSLKRLGAPALSPDGAWAAVPVTTFDLKEDKGLTDLWLLPTSGGAARRLTTAEAGAGNPVFSPDGKWIAFESKRGTDEQTQIWVIATDGGEARRVTDVPTGASAPKWFPDSKRLAFMSRVWADLESWDDQGKRQKERKDSKMTAQVFDRPRLRHWDRWLDDRQTHVFSVAIDDGATARITLGTGLQLTRHDPGRDSFDVSPDGAEVAFAADADPTGLEPRLDLHVVPTGGGAARKISDGPHAFDDGPLYSPDGTYLTYGRQMIRGFYADKTRLVLYERATGKTRVVTEGWDRSARGLVWTPDAKALYGSIDDAGTERVYRIDVATGQASAVTGATSHASLALARDGRTLVALRQSFLEPPTLVRVDPASGASTKLSSFNDEILAAVDLGTYESVTYKGAGGVPIQMWINYPPGFDGTKRWPVYMLVHGGPHNGITDAWTFRWNAQVFSGWGYVTAWPNFHGSSGFGQAFTDSINPEQADLPYKDVIKAADWLAAQPWADKDRFAAAGASYGGYLVSVILGRKHPFKAIVAHAAVYNWYTQYAADYGAEHRRHGEFWENDERFRRNSPHFGAGKFTTPTLVIHGAEDYRVPLNHGLELFQTLQNRGVKSRLIYYPNENHWILKPANSLFWYAECRKWIEPYAPPGGR
jgi:dipeptidyl aminopeptidase/acylaminoacyl peptidase